jgi:glycosyltransferase involved in cell wall biosynthesis
MDLVAEMLSRQLSLAHSDALTSLKLRPSFHRRFTLLPGLARKRAAFNADRLLNRFVDYPRWLRSSAPSFDAFHLIDHSYSQLLHVLPPGRAVVTCHDLDTFRCVLTPERDSRPLLMRLMTRRILDGFRRAAHVVCVSASVRDELLAHNLFPSERLSVVLNGVDPEFSPLPDPAADAQLRRLLGSLPRPWLLHVSSTIPRKRIDVLLKVFASFRRTHPAASLIRAGGPFTPDQSALARQLGLPPESVAVLPFLDRAVLASLYRNADIFLLTSEAEGFGLPIIEAMACGCVAVASDIPVLREVGGPVLVSCPLSDLAAWDRTLAGLMEEKTASPGLWQSRRDAALARAAGFSWNRSVEQLVGIYRRVFCF